MIKNNKIISYGDDELRAKNIACIRKYVDARTNTERGERWKCYVEDCRFGAAEIPPLKGIQKAEQATKWNLIYFPNYVFNDNVIFQTQDPNLYVVMSKGTGGVYFPHYGEEKVYNNVYFHVIRMRDGLMQDYFEYGDGRKLYDALGIELPKIVMPAGWPEADEEERSFDPYLMPEYSQPETPDLIPDGDIELRARNVACIRKYVDARTPEDRGERWKCFVDDCTSGAVGPALKGIKKAEQCTKWNLIYFPNYVFNDNVIFETQDPNFFMVMSNGIGGIYYPEYGEEKVYENVYFHVIRMRDGKMQNYYEWANNLLCYHTLGIELPKIVNPPGWPKND
jgi:hypothetical protein